MSNLSQKEQPSLPVLRSLTSSPRCLHLPTGVWQTGLAMLASAKGGMWPGGGSPSLSSHEPFSTSGWNGASGAVPAPLEVPGRSWQGIGTVSDRQSDFAGHEAF